MRNVNIGRTKPAIQLSTSGVSKIIEPLTTISMFSPKTLNGFGKTNCLIAQNTKETKVYIFIKNLQKVFIVYFIKPIRIK